MSKSKSEYKQNIEQFIHTQPYPFGVGVILLFLIVLFLLLGVTGVLH